MFEQERERESDDMSDDTGAALPATTPTTRTATLEEFVDTENEHPTPQTGSAVITDVVYHETNVPWYDYAVITFSFRDESTMTRRFPIYEDGRVDDALTDLLDYLDISEGNSYSAAYETTGHRVPAFSDGERWFIYIPPTKSLARSTVLELFETRLFEGDSDGVSLRWWVPAALALFTGVGAALGSALGGVGALLTLGLVGMTLTAIGLNQIGVPGTVF